MQTDIQKKMLSALKQSDPTAYANLRESTKKYEEAHKEIKEDKDLQLMLISATSLLGKDEVESIVNSHFKQMEIFGKGPNLVFLYTKLSGRLEKYTLSHNVYVLNRPQISENVEWASDEPDKNGEMPKHRQFSVTLWENDLKQIIQLFITDNKVEPHSKLQTGHYYRMLIGKNSKTGDWVASADPSITEIPEGFEIDWNGLVQYILTHYDSVQEPYEDIVYKIKTDPKKRVAIMCGYVRKMNYIELVPIGKDGESSNSIGMFGASLVQSLPQDGMVLVIGKLQKYKPKNDKGVPLFQYVMSFPDVLLYIEDNQKIVHVVPSIQVSQAQAFTGQGKTSDATSGAVESNSMKTGIEKELEDAGLL